MGFLILMIIFIVLFVLFLIYSSYFSQIFIHERRKKDYIDRFRRKVKGIYLSKGYFATSHKIISKKEFKSLSNTQKSNYGSCYNAVKFKTDNAEWELFFHLVKDGTFFSEILNIRVFPNQNYIKSEGNVEKNYSRINIFTNSMYLSNLLESKEMYETLEWLIKNNGDILLISQNGLHFKAFLDHNEKLNTDETLDIIKVINNIKNKIYRKEILEY